MLFPIHEIYKYSYTLTTQHIHTKKLNHYFAAIDNKFTIVQKRRQIFDFQIEAYSVVVYVLHVCNCCWCCCCRCCLLLLLLLFVCIYLYKCDSSTHLNTYSNTLQLLFFFFWSKHFWYCIVDGSSALMYREQGTHAIWLKIELEWIYNILFSCTINGFGERSNVQLCIRVCAY